MRGHANVRWMLWVVIGFSTAGAAAGDFAGLVPGKTRAEAVEKILGKPKASDGLPTFAGEKYDAKEISVELDQRRVIQTISIFPKRLDLLADLERWLRLGEPYVNKPDEIVKGLERRFYVPQLVGLVARNGLVEQIVYASPHCGAGICLGAARDKFKDGHRKEFAVELRKLCGLFPEDPALRFALAREWFAVGDLKAAEIEVEAGLQLEPSDAAGKSLQEEISAGLELIRYLTDAEAGDPISQYRLGRMYERGKVVLLDWKTAARWYRMSAEQGYAEGEYQWATALSGGMGVERNEADAVTWYRKAADKGHAGAELALGRLYAAGRGVTRDDNEARRWFQLAVEHGHPEAPYVLGLMFWNGTGGVAKDPVEGLRLIRTSAERGFLDAQWFIAVELKEGRNVPKDEVEAARWYRRAAEQGHAEAQLQLGFVYERGWGVQRDFKEAFYWFERASKSGSLNGTNTLGAVYLNGVLAPKDEVRAFSLFNAAARAGHAPAQFNLGILLWSGRGTTKDQAAAVKWWRDAAAQNQPNAQHQLGLIYAAGMAVPKSESEAVNWFRLAARQGFEPSQAELAKRNLK